MKTDEQGWNNAPAAAYWHCPECDCNSAVADWQTGPEDSRICPNCDHLFTAGVKADGKHVGHHAVGGSGRISSAAAPGKVKRDPA